MRVRRRSPLRSLVIFRASATSPTWRPGVDRARRPPYRNTFSAVPADIGYRPRARTRRPVIAGAQTATVTGKSGEEIWTDSYGRVKVKFHWDRSAARDESSSCWVRVAQGWAGKNWGSFFLPRIGQEVVVSFLDGDPDRPLVTGCVYNAEQSTPYPLLAKPDTGTVAQFFAGRRRLERTAVGGQGRR
ncbi:MAG: type VI secretion system tip protein TssI/VgrG [Bryobacteraceae bacterium]